VRGLNAAHFRGKLNSGSLRIDFGKNFKCAYEIGLYGDSSRMLHITVCLVCNLCGIQQSHVKSSPGNAALKEQILPLAIILDIPVY
jgi:hypothetical protein